MTRRNLVFGLVLATVIPEVAASQSPPFFFDTTFDDANWTITVESINGGGTGAGVHHAGGWRTTVNELNAAAPGEVNTVYVFHLRSGATYHPSSGPIESIEYLETTQRLSGPRQLCGLAIRQNGVVYYGTGFLSPSELNRWIPAWQWLAPSAFDAIAPGLQRPNFSAAGSMIEFGFYRASSTAVGGPATYSAGGIDGWHLVLNLADAPVATSPSTWGKVKSLYRSR